MNIRHPNITNGSAAEQLQQIKSYLYQLVEQLNMQTSSEEPGQSQTVASGGTVSGQLQTGGGTEQVRSPESTFNQIKSLIIKSADIVDAYYTKMSEKFDSSYVAVSEFGTYQQTVTSEIEKSAKGLQEQFSNIQSLVTDLGEKIIDTDATIRIGELFVVGDDNLEPELGQTSLPEGSPVYGVEIGQATSEYGVEKFKKFARFTAYGMTLYDNNGNLTAYITDKRMHIPNVVVKTSMTRGGFQETLENDGDSVERWVGLT